MNILVIADYPRATHPFSGIFNQRSVRILNELCNRVEVMSPRPYVPPFLSLVPRWRVRTVARSHEIHDGVSIYRPACLRVPRIGGAFWDDLGAFLLCRRTASAMHHRIGFDAIISFGLVGAGGIAWRIGRHLGIPASGWATGGDLNRYAGTALGRVALRAIERLDLVFYQSRQLLETAAGRLGMPLDTMAKDKHVVLSRGIPEPPPLCRAEIRQQIRSYLGIRNDQVVLLNVGGVWRDKGVFDLLDATSLAVAKDGRIVCVLVGSVPALDESYAVQRKVEETPSLRGHVKIVPACNSEQVWEYLSAADIFVFASHNEGMPNSLLEAMVMGIPAIAFAIPPVREIEAGTGALVLVPPFNSGLFSEAILQIAASTEDRIRIGEVAKARVMDRFMVRKNMAEALRRLSEIVERCKSQEQFVCGS